MAYSIEDKIHNIIRFRKPGSKAFLDIVNNAHSMFPYYAHAYACIVPEEERRTGIYRSLLAEALEYVKGELKLKGLVFMPKFYALRDPSHIARRSDLNDEILRSWYTKHDMDRVFTGYLDENRDTYFLHEFL